MEATILHWRCHVYEVIASCWLQEAELSAQGRCVDVMSPQGPLKALSIEKSSKIQENEGSDLSCWSQEEDSPRRQGGTCKGWGGA